MKKFLLLLLAVPAFAQSPVIGGSVQYVTTAPSGACVASPPVKVLFSSGVIYTCNNGTWAASGGGGGPTFAYPTGTGFTIVTGGASWGTTLADPLPVAHGGTGTASPALVQGTNVTITGSWPNQTINSTASGSGTAPLLRGGFTSGSIGAGSVSSLTATGTLVSGDLIVCYVRTNTAGRTFTWTSSPSTTWNTMTVQSNGQSAQMAWGIAASSASTGVTATYNSADTFGGLVCLAYSGAAGTKNGDAENTGSSVTPAITTGFDTTGRTLNILCASVASTGFAYTPGNLAQMIPNFRQADTGTNPASTSTIACFESVNGWRLSKMTGAVTYGTSVVWTTTIGAFDW